MLLAGEHLRSLSARRYNRPAIRLATPDGGPGRILKFSELVKLGFDHIHLRESMLLAHSSLSYEYESQEF